MWNKDIVHIMDDICLWVWLLYRHDALPDICLINCRTICHALWQNLPLEMLHQFPKIYWEKLKGKCFLSSGCKRMVKKQSFKSIIIRWWSIEMAVGEGSPGWRLLIISMTALTARRSCNNLHFPDFFFMTNIGVFHGQVDGSICPATSCSWTSSMAAWSFSWVKGHWSTQTGVSVSHLILIGFEWVVGDTKAPKENSDVLALTYHF